MCCHGVHAGDERSTELFSDPGHTSRKTFSNGWFGASSCMPFHMRFRTTSVAFVAALSVAACTASHSGATVAAVPNGTPRVAPVHGSVIVVGGGSMGPEIYAEVHRTRGWPGRGHRRCPYGRWRFRLSARLARCGRIGSGGREERCGAAHDQQKSRGLRRIHRPAENRRRRVVRGRTSVSPRRFVRWHKDRKSIHGSARARRRDRRFVSRCVDPRQLHGSRRALKTTTSSCRSPGYERAFGYLRGVGIDQHVESRASVLPISQIP